MDGHRLAQTGQKGRFGTISQACLQPRAGGTVAKPLQGVTKSNWWPNVSCDAWSEVLVSAMFRHGAHGIAGVSRTGPAIPGDPQNAAGQALSNPIDP